MQKWIIAPKIKIAQMYVIHSITSNSQSTSPATVEAGRGIQNSCDSGSFGRAGVSAGGARVCKKLIGEAITRFMLRVSVRAFRAVRPWCVGFRLRPAGGVAF